MVIHVEYGQRICFLKKVAYNIINDLAENKAGTLSIGLTPERGINMLMSIYPEFHKQFPNIKIKPTEIGVHKQQNMVNKGDLDIGFVTVTPKDKNNDDYDHILYEDIFLAVPRSHPLAKNASAPGESFTTIDLKAFQDEYFVLMFKSSTMRTLIDPLFEEAGFQPKILFETASNVTMRNMVKNNMACTLLAQSYVGDLSDIAYFYLPQRPRWELCTLHKKGYYLTNAAQNFISLAMRYFKEKSLEMRTQSF
ncbi:LysR family transcriptional regulator substrate-binding protein [Brotaphodocola catenula]|uniref:LysR family transcriptional regulator substrate-binding protein n=1 Tax=Brotaphodocola catenula TaxID=2885361 RepID=A0AAE3AQ92_9FIRM|nr:LysR family transcriptional regulator substrate-binding protein [Brotaphodocola catenula]MCC2165846.1 LysR family transcriptional regulator substrate-binding protein [Brotaphodocola catenula]